MQLQEVHVAYGDGTLKVLSGTTIDEAHLRLSSRELQLLRTRIVIRICKIKHCFDIFFGCTIEHWSSERNTIFQISGELHDLIISQGADIFLLAATFVVDLLKECAHFSHISLRSQHCRDTLT